MKNIIALFLLVSSGLAFGQTAISASILFKNNRGDYKLDGRISRVESSGLYRESRIPTLAFAYQRFQKRTGNYVRWHLTECYWMKTTDLEVGAIGGGTPVVTRFTKLNAGGGRLGYGRGYKLKLGMKHLDAYFEPTLSLGWHFVKTTPNVVYLYPEKHTEYFAELAPNFVLQKRFRQTFVRLEFLLPSATFGLEKNYVGNPSFTKRQQNKENAFVNTRLLNGIGLGLGHAFGKWKDTQQTKR